MSNKKLSTPYDVAIQIHCVKDNHNIPDNEKTDFRTNIVRGYGQAVTEAVLKSLERVILDNMKRDREYKGPNVYAHFQIHDVLKVIEQLLDKGLGCYKQFDNITMMDLSTIVSGDNPEDIKKGDPVYFNSIDPDKEKEADEVAERMGFKSGEQTS